MTEGHKLWPSQLGVSPSDPPNSHHGKPGKRRSLSGCPPHHHARHFAALVKEAFRFFNSSLSAACRASNQLRPQHFFPPTRDAQMKVSRVLWNTKTRHACGVLAGAAASPCGYTRALCSRHLLPWPPVRNLWGTESRVGLLRRANLFIRREPRRPSRKKTASLLSDAQRPCVRQRYILVAATHYANTI